MDATNTLDQAPIQGDERDLQTKEEPVSIRVLKPIELSLVGGGTGLAQFF